MIRARCIGRDTRECDDVAFQDITLLCRGVGARCCLGSVAV